MPTVLLIKLTVAKESRTLQSTSSEPCSSAPHHHGAPRCLTQVCTACPLRKGFELQRLGLKLLLHFLQVISLFLASESYPVSHESFDAPVGRYHDTKSHHEKEEVHIICWDTLVQRICLDSRRSERQVPAGHECHHHPIHAEEEGRLFITVQFALDHLAGEILLRLCGCLLTGHVCVRGCHCFRLGHTLR